MAIRWEPVRRGRATCDMCKKRLPKGALPAIPFGVSVMHGTLYFCGTECMDQELKAQGFARALEEIFAAAQNVDQKTMTLQYFDTLKAIGTSPSTKYIFPLEFTSMLDGFLRKDAEK